MIVLWTVIGPERDHIAVQQPVDRGIENRQLACRPILLQPGQALDLKVLYLRQICLLQLRISKQLRPWPCERAGAVFQHVGVVTDLERKIHVLLYAEDANPRRGKAQNRLEDLVDDAR